MPPDYRSASFAFRKENENRRPQQTCRQKLQERFEGGNNESRTQDRSNRSILSNLSMNETRKVLRNGVESLSKVFNSVRTTVGELSQRFKNSTRRRQILEEGPTTPNCVTPHTYSKAVLGRTPTKLYSPFSIESPYNAATTFEKTIADSSSQAVSRRRFFR